MSRWGKPIKNKKHKDPRYFLNEEQEQEELELLQEKKAVNPLGPGGEGTRIGPEDDNPLGGSQGTRIAPEDGGEPLQKRVAKIEQILKQLVAKLK